MSCRAVPRSAAALRHRERRPDRPPGRRDDRRVVRRDRPALG